MYVLIFIYLLPRLFLWVEFLCIIPSFNYAKNNSHKLYSNIDWFEHQNHKVNKSILVSQTHIWEKTGAVHRYFRCSVENRVGSHQWHQNRTQEEDIEGDKESWSSRYIWIAASWAKLCVYICISFYVCNVCMDVVCIHMCTSKYAQKLEKKKQVWEGISWTWKQTSG